MMFMMRFVRARIDTSDRLIVIAKGLEVLPTDDDCLIELFTQIIQIAEEDVVFRVSRQMDEDDVLFLNDAMDIFSAAVLCDNVPALTAVRQHLYNSILPIQCWARRLFAKLAEPNDLLIEELICQTLRRKGMEQIMLKALARLAGRPLDLVKEYMSCSYRMEFDNSAQWLPASDRDFDFLEIDSPGHIMIIKLRSGVSPSEAVPTLLEVVVVTMLAPSSFFFCDL